jgi:hypothetical protein
VEEIINFNVLFEEKKFQNLKIKKTTSGAISFVDDEVNKNGVGINFTNLNYDNNDKF